MLAWKFVNSLIIQKPLDMQSWNLDTLRVHMNAFCKPSLGRQVTWPKFYRPKIGKKLTSLNRYILIISDIDEKWFVVFEHSINHLSFGYVHLPQLKNYFSCFAFFFVFFLFLLPLSTFKQINALYSKFEQLKIWSRTSVGLKSGVPGWGGPP